MPQIQANLASAVQLAFHSRLNQSGTFSGNHITLGESSRKSLDSKSLDSMIEHRTNHRHSMRSKWRLFSFEPPSIVFKCTLDLSEAMQPKAVEGPLFGSCCCLCAAAGLATLRAATPALHSRLENLAERLQTGLAATFEKL